MGNGTLGSKAKDGALDTAQAKTQVLEPSPKGLERALSVLRQVLDARREELKSLDEHLEKLKESSDDVVSAARERLQTRRAAQAREATTLTEALTGLSELKETLDLFRKRIAVTIGEKETELAEMGKLTLEEKRLLMKELEHVREALHAREKTMRQFEDLKARAEALDAEVKHTRALEQKLKVTSEERDQLRVDLDEKNRKIGELHRLVAILDGRDPDAETQTTAQKTPEKGEKKPWAVFGSFSGAAPPTVQVPKMAQIPVSEPGPGLGFLDATTSSLGPLVARPADKGNGTTSGTGLSAFGLGSDDFDDLPLELEAKDAIPESGGGELVMPSLEDIATPAQGLRVGTARPRAPQATVLITDELLLTVAEMPDGGGAPFHAGGASEKRPSARTPGGPAKAKPPPGPSSTIYITDDLLAQVADKDDKG
jgi:hypothetical protein